MPAALPILTQMITILKKGRPRRRPAIPLVQKKKHSIQTFSGFVWFVWFVWIFTNIFKN